jgi:hypothetical protein
MNENAIKDAYNLFVSQGYKKSEEEFKTLMSENSDALNDAYKLFVSQGYKKEIEDFAELMGADPSAVSKKKAESLIPGFFPDSQGLDSSETQQTQEQPTGSELGRSRAELYLDNPNPTAEESTQYLIDLRDAGEDVFDDGSWLDQLIAGGLSNKTMAPLRESLRAAVELDELGVSGLNIQAAAGAQKFYDFTTRFMAGEEDLAKVVAQQSSIEHMVYDFSNVNGSDQTNTLKRALLEAKEMGSSEYQKILEQLPDDEELTRRLKDAKDYREQYAIASKEDAAGMAAMADPKTDQQVRDEYIQELFIETSGSKIKDRIKSLLPEELKNDARFLEMLSDRIYSEAGVPTDLDGDNKYNDVPMVEYLGKMLDDGLYSTVSSLDYGLTVAAGYINDDPDFYKNNEEKRAEINSNLEQIRSLNTQFIGGISESLAMGDMGNAVQQTIGGLVQTLPIMAVTLATAPIGGTGGLIAGAALSGTLGGIQTYVGIRDMQVVDPNDPSKMIDAYTESTALGQAFISGLGESVFSLVGGKIFKNASKAASMGQMIGVSRGSMRAFAKGVAKEYGLAMAEEGLTEFATELTNYIAESQLKEGAEFDLNEAIRAGVDALIVGAAAGVGFKIPGDLISGKLNYNSYAAGALFDPANIEVYSRIDSEIALIKDKLSNESDPAKKKKYESQISALSVKKAEIRQERSKFFDSIWARSPMLMEKILDLDKNIHEALANARQSKADGDLDLEKTYKEKAKALAELKMKEIDEFSKNLEEDPISEIEKSKIFFKKIDDTIADTDGYISDIKESLEKAKKDFSMFEGSPMEAAARKRIDEFENQLNDATQKKQFIEDVKSRLAKIRSDLDKITQIERSGGKLTKKQKADKVELIGATMIIQESLGMIGGVDFASDMSSLDPNDFEFEMAEQAELDDLLSLSTSTNMDTAIEAIANGAASVKGEASKTLLDTAREVIEDDLLEEADNIIDLSSNTSFIDKNLKGPLAGNGTFAHMTAENPGAQPLSPEENAKRNEELKKKLIEAGYEIIEVRGQYGSPENSFYVKDISLEDAMKFGEMFGQESVAHSDGLVYTMGENKGKMHPSTGDVVVDQNLDDNFSYVRTKEGSIKYQIGYDFDSMVDADTKATEVKTEEQPTQETATRGEKSVDIKNNNDVRALIDESVQNGDAKSYTTNTDGSIGVEPIGVLSGSTLANLNKAVSGLSKTLGRELRVVVAQSSKMGSKFTEDVGAFFDSKTDTIFIDPNDFADGDSLSNAIFEEIAHGVFNDVVASMDINSRQNLISDFITTIDPKKNITETLEEKIRRYSKALNVPLKSEGKSGVDFILDNIGTDLFAKEVVAEILGSVDVESLTPSAFDKLRRTINKIFSKILPPKISSKINIKTKADMQRFVDAMAKIKSGERASINRNGNVSDISYSLEGKKEGVNTSQSELRKIFPDRDFVSPFDLPDGPITITYDKSFYKRGKAIGNEPVTMNFNNKEHFINWWKKTTFDNSRYGENRTGLYLEDSLAKIKPKKLEFSNHRVEINGKAVFVDTDVLVNKYKPYIKKEKKQFNIPFYKQRGDVSRAYNEVSSDLQAAYKDNLISEQVYNATMQKLKETAAWGIGEEMHIEKRGGDANAYFNLYKWPARDKYNEIAQELRDLRVKINEGISKASEKQGGVFKYEEGGKFYSDKSRGIDEISYSLFIPEGKLGKKNISTKLQKLKERFESAVADRVNGVPTLECNSSLKKASVREICLEYIREMYPDATPAQRLAYATLLENQAILKALNDPNNEYIQANPIDFQKNSMKATELFAEHAFNSLGMQYKPSYLPIYRMIVALTSNGTDRASNFIASQAIFKSLLLKTKTDAPIIPDYIINSIANRRGVFKDLNGERVETMALHLGYLNEDIQEHIYRGVFNSGAFMTKMHSKPVSKKGNTLDRKWNKGWNYAMNRYGGNSVGKLGSHSSVMMGGDAIVGDSNFINFLKKYTGDLMDYATSSYYFNRYRKKVKGVFRKMDIDTEGLSDYELFNLAKLVKENPNTSEKNSRALKAATAKLVVNENDISFDFLHGITMEAKSFIENTLGENSSEVKMMMEGLTPEQKEMFYTQDTKGNRVFQFPAHLFQAIAYAGEQAYRKTSQFNNIKGYTDDFVLYEAITGAKDQAAIDEIVKKEKLDYENEQMSTGIHHYNQSTTGPVEILNTEHLDIDAVEIRTTNATEIRLVEDVNFEPQADNISKARNFEDVDKNSLIGINGKEGDISKIPDTGVEVFFNPLLSDYPTTKNFDEIKSASRLIVVDGRMFVDGNISIGETISTIEDSVDSKSYAGVTESARAKIMSYAVNILGMDPENVNVDHIYDEMSKSTLMKMNADGSFASNVKSNNDAISYNLRLRETAKKAAKKVRGARDKIIANPENYIKPQRLKNIKSRLSQMSDAELVAEIESAKLSFLINSEDNIGALAAGELINREVARAEITGNYDAVSDLYTEVAKMGTTAGRILRQLAELSSSTPRGMASQIEAAAKKSGNYLTPEQKIKVEEACEKLLNATKKYNDLSGKARSGQDVEAELKTAFNDLMAAKKNIGEITNRYVNKGFGDIFTQLIQGNLLVPESHQTNVVSNMLRMFDLAFVNAIALPIENIFKRITEGKTATTRKYSFLAQIEGFKALGSGFLEATKTAFTGQDPDTRSEWRMAAGLMPFKSIMDAVSGKDLPLNDKGKVNIKNRVRLGIQGLLGISPEVNFRLLGLADTPFRRYVEAVELYHVAKERGLEGEALKNFIKYPDLKTLDAVQSEGRKLTFQEDTTSSKYAMAMVNGIEKYIGMGLTKAFGDGVIDGQQAAKVFVRVFTPYVKTPANILSESLTYISPYYAALRMASDLRKGDTRAASQNLAKAMVGSIAAETAMILIKEGLITGSVGYEDKEDKALANLMHDHFAPDSINITGLTRYLYGGDPAYRKTDWSINYKKLGIMGQVIATVVNSADIDELKARDYSKGKFLHHAIRDSFGMNPMSGVSEALDQSFLQGMESFLQVLTSLKAGDASAERAIERFTNSIMKVASSAVLPNSMSATNRAQREWMPDMRVSRDMPLEERLATHFKYIIKDRFWSTSDLPIRVNWKGEDIPQTPDERNGIFYHLFDITNARQGASDMVTNEIWRLYENTGHPSLIAATPKYADYYGGRIDVPNLIKNNEKRALRMLDRKYTFLEDKEFVDARLFFDVETLARVMRVSCRDKYEAAEKLLSSEKYKRMADKEKLDALNKLSENFNSAVELDRGKFRPHTIELLNIFQDIYENEWGKDEE